MSAVISLKPFQPKKRVYGPLSSKPAFAIIPALTDKRSKRSKTNFLVMLGLKNKRRTK